MRSNSSGRVFGAGLAAVGVAGTAAAIAVAVSPTAGATVEAISPSDPVPAVGGTYTLGADLTGVSSALPVTWNDNGVSITNGVGILPFPAGHTSITWTPTTPGQHIITATQGTSTQTLIITVIPGTGTGATPPTITTTLPTAPTTTPQAAAPTTTPTTTSPSGGTGSGGTGSATGSAGTLVGGLLRGLFGSS